MNDVFPEEGKHLHPVSYTVLTGDGWSCRTLQDFTSHGCNQSNLRGCMYPGDRGITSSSAGDLAVMMLSARSQRRASAMSSSTDDMALSSKAGLPSKQSRQVP